MLTPGTHELRRSLQGRLLALRIAFLLCFALLAVGFWVVQVVQHTRFERMAANNHLRTIPLRAPRGLLFDRNGAVLVENRTSFTIALVRDRSPDVDRAIRRLADAGSLRGDVTLIHCTSLSDSDYDAIASSGTSVVLAPSQEMAGGLGMPPVQQLMDRQIKPGLGVGRESLAPGDAFAQMRAVIAVQHARYFDLKLAGKAGLPMGPLAFTSVPGASRAGDGVVALITLWNGKKQKQWAVQFEIAPLTVEEAMRNDRFNLSMQSTTSGQKIEISAKPAFALKIRALGPFSTFPYNPKTAGKSASGRNSKRPPPTSICPLARLSSKHSRPRPRRFLPAVSSGCALAAKPARCW